MVDAVPPPPKRTSPLKILCLGCAGLLLLSVLGCTGLVGLAVQMVKKSGLYRDTVAMAKEHPEVQQALGQPIEVGFWAGGSIKVRNDSGSGKFVTNLSGPLGEGLLKGRGTKTKGTWTIQAAVLRLESGEEIVLVGEKKQESPPPETKSGETVATPTPTPSGS